MLLPCKYWHVLAGGRRIAWIPVPLLLYQMWAFNILSVMCLSLTFSGLEKKLNSTPSFGQAAALSHILLSWINYLLVLVDDLIVQNDLPSHRCHLGKYKALKDYCPTRKFTGPWLPNRTFFEPCFVFLYFVNPVSSLFSNPSFTGTITTTSLHLEDVLRSLCYLSAWLINLECHVMSMSKEVADGTMNGITITCWTILLIYKISSDQSLLVSLKKIIY